VLAECPGDPAALKMLQRLTPDERTENGERRTEE